LFWIESEKVTLSGKVVVTDTKFASFGAVGLVANQIPEARPLVCIWNEMGRNHGVEVCGVVLDGIGEGCSEWWGGWCGCYRHDFAILSMVRFVIWLFREPR